MGKFDFIAIDFETANTRYDSACAVGIVGVADGEIVASCYSLLNPKSEFLPENVSIHGITESDVKDAPTFEEAWQEISLLFGHCAVLAHNAAFDMSVLKRTIPSWDAERLEFKYIDTVSLCRDFVPGKKNLVHCAEELGIPLEHHHNALEDATACAKIALTCIERAGAKNLGDLCFSLPNVKIHNFSELHTSIEYSHAVKKAPIKSSPRVSDIKCTVECVDASSPLCGKSIVFTGELSIDRAEAMQIAVNAGAVVKSGVSKKTNYLVVGAQDKRLVGEDGLSGKEEKAYALNESGAANIQIINEKQFLVLANKGGCLMDQITMLQSPEENAYHFI